MAEAKKFASEDAYDAIVDAAAAKYSTVAAPIPPELIKAFIALESNFNPRATRAEPQLKPVATIPGLEHGGDASYGLMQVLYRTAWMLGYRGTVSGLYDPATSIDLGTRYLADNIRAAKAHGYALDSAISAYNAGGSGDRPGDGKRLTSRKDGHLADGKTLAPFVNQAYVNRILSYFRHFQIRSSEAKGHPPPNPKQPSGPASEVITSDQTVRQPEPQRMLAAPLVVQTGTPQMRQDTASIHTPVYLPRLGRSSLLAIVAGALVLYLSLSLVNDSTEVSR
jgi:hypothetical protein